jgi:predicted nucleotidyltransferase
VYLFGSYADGTATASSDVDIAILTDLEVKFSGRELFDLSVKLGRKLGKEVDLVHLNKMYTDFRFVIVSTGKQIFCKDIFFGDTFDMLAYSQFQKLEDERREIVEDIKIRGRIYD